MNVSTYEMTWDYYETLLGPIYLPYENLDITKIQISWSFTTFQYESLSKHYTILWHFMLSNAMIGCKMEEIKYSNCSSILLDFSYLISLIKIVLIIIMSALCQIRKKPNL